MTAPPLELESWSPVDIDIGARGHDAINCMGVRGRRAMVGRHMYRVSSPRTSTGPGRERTSRCGRAFDDECVASTIRNVIQREGLATLRRVLNIPARKINRGRGVRCGGF